jgi:prepilin peptidase CpaA
MLATILLIVLVLVAAVTDAARHRIYNWTTYPGMLAGLLLAGIGALVEWLSPESASQWQPVIGWLTVGEALGGFLLCGLLMAVCFVFFPTGGGDVKLLAMVGALVGVEKGLEILLWTFIFGGCLGLTLLIWRVGALTLIQRAWQMARGLFSLGTALRLPEQERRDLRSPIFLGPCAAVAVAMALAPWPSMH